MSATSQNYKVALNANFRIAVQVRDAVTGQVVNITGYSVHMQARPNKDPTSTPIYLDASVGSGITLTDPVNGRLDLNIPKATIVALTFSAAYYDIAITDLIGNVDIILEGILTTTKGVTA